MEKIPVPFTPARGIEIAAKAHAGQKDKAGITYLVHVMTVMNQLRGPIPRIVGVLHDVVEDGHATFEDLEREGCPPEAIAALRLVTHPEGFQNTEEEYLRWIQSIRDSGNQTAIDVKWADLTHNSDPRRIANPTEKDTARMEKYRKSMDILRPVVSEYLVN